MLSQHLTTTHASAEGLPVDNLYVAEKVDIAKEFYLAIKIDRELSCPVLIVETIDGTVTDKTMTKDLPAVIKVPLKYSEGITKANISTICEDMSLQSEEKSLPNLLINLYRLFRERDLTLVEINRLVIEKGSRRLICADARISIDNAASKRQSSLFALRDRGPETNVEIEAERHGLVYVQLEGNIGCLVNGAGLAMATNDAVAYYGGRCANFLDGGGQATKETMVKAFELILSDSRVNTVLVNIYGGGLRAIDCGSIMLRKLS